MRLAMRLGLVVAFLATITLVCAAQDGGAYISATSVGTGMQMGANSNFLIQISVREWSTPDEANILMDAYKSKGMKGLSAALSRMKSKGNISMPRTTGYEIVYARIFDTPTGKMIRMVTNRRITPGEVWNDSWTQEYALTALQINVNNDGKNTGTLIPAAQFTTNAEGKVEIEAMQDPWNLTNIEYKPKN